MILCCPFYVNVILQRTFSKILLEFVYFPPTEFPLVWDSVNVPLTYHVFFAEAFPLRELISQIHNNWGRRRLSSPSTNTHKNHGACRRNIHFRTEKVEKEATKKYELVKRGETSVGVGTFTSKVVASLHDQQLDMYFVLEALLIFWWNSNLCFACSSNISPQ